MKARPSVYLNLKRRKETFTLKKSFYQCTSQHVCKANKHTLDKISNGKYFELAGTK